MWKAIGIEDPVIQPLQNVDYKFVSKGHPRRWQRGKLQFRADFDSGNLANVIELSENKEYELWIRPDCAGETFETKHRTWFYFGLSGVTPGQTLKFNIANMNKQSKLFSFDMRPVVCSPSTSKAWSEVKEAVKYKHTPVGFRVTFSHTFTSQDETFFALSIPFSCEDNNRLLKKVEDYLQARDDIYFCREILTYTNHGRPIDVLTISSKKGLTSKCEQEIDSTYPCTRASKKVNAFDNSKKVVIVTSRVHPGEVPASHVFNGMLSFLIQSDDERASILRDQFVFKLIPIVNPDGVSFGHYRADSLGQNLNRFYDNPCPEKQPETHAIKNLILHYHNKGDLEVCFDLHAHANRMGSFAYGNALEYEQQLETIMYNKLVSMNSPYFDFRSCCFSESNMTNKDKNGFSKEGSNRVSVFRATNLKHIYTIETNYCCASLTNAIQSAYNGPRTISPSHKIHSRAKFNVESFGQVGKALLLAIIDLKGLNPYSRLKASEFKDMQALRNWASSYLNASITKMKNGTRTRRNSSVCTENRRNSVRTLYQINSTKNKVHSDKERTNVSMDAISKIQISDTENLKVDNRIA